MESAHFLNPPFLHEQYFIRIPEGVALSYPVFVAVSLDTLVPTEVPGVKDKDKVVIENRRFYPRVVENAEKPIFLHFFNAGSGGKKALFKACYAIAIHRLSAKYPSSPLPNILIIDTPT